ncbi:MAG: hypothetical protein Alpg2KO_13760 [Alphaproteobacteria bacterium]
MTTQPNNPQECLLDQHQTAKYLALSPKTLANWRTQGKGPEYHKIGGRIRYRQSDLDAYVNRCRYANTSQYERMR